MCLPLAFGAAGKALLGGNVAATSLLAKSVGTASILGPIAQGMLSFGAQAQQARMQAEAQKRASIAENARYMAQISATRQQQAADALRVAQEVQQANRASMEAMARKQVAAGAAGISTESASYLAEMRDLERQVAEHSFAFEQRQAIADQSYELKARDLGLQTQQNFININRPIDQPDFLGTALTSALGSLESYSKAKNRELTIGKQAPGITETTGSIR